MSKLSTGNRTRISNHDVEFYEDNTARMLHILAEVRAITMDVTDADVMEKITRRLASITEAAGQTRRALIAERNRQQMGERQGEGDIEE